MNIYSLQNAGQNQQELNVLVRRCAGIQHIDAVICGDGPVIMLAGSIHTGKGLLMKETGQAMMSGHPL